MSSVVTVSPGQNGAFEPSGLPVATVTGAWTLVPSEFSAFMVDATTGGFTVLLPPVASWVGAPITIKAITATANLVTVDGSGSDKIDGALTITLGAAGSGATYLGVTIVSDGVQWRVSAVHGPLLNVPALSTANTFTAKQTFQSPGEQISAQFGDASGLVQAIIGGKGSGAAAQCGAVVICGSASDGSLGYAWDFGLDGVATVPYRDGTTSRESYGGIDSDTDGYYASYYGPGGNEASNSASSWGFGLAQPADNGPYYRVKIMAGGTSEAAPTQGGLLVQFVTGQTGDTLALGATGDATTAFRVRYDGTVIAHANPQNNVTGTTGSTVSGAATLIDANASFASDIVGSYIGTGAGFPDGAYVYSWQSATQITMNVNATGTVTGSVSYTLYGRAYQFRNNSSLGLFTASNSATPCVVMPCNVAIGSGVGNPTSTLDVSNSGANNSTFKLRTGSWGAVQIAAAGATPGDCSIETVNATALRLGSNGAYAVTIDVNQNVFLGTCAKATAAALATTATAGFPHLTSGAGAPTGVPSSVPTGAVPVYVNSSGAAGTYLYLYIGGAWKAVA